MRNTKKQKVKWHHKSNCTSKNINCKLLTKSVKVHTVNREQNSTLLSTVDTLDSINNRLKSKSKIWVISFSMEKYTSGKRQSQESWGGHANIGQKKL